MRGLLSTIALILVFGERSAGFCSLKLSSIAPALSMPRRQHRSGRASFPGTSCVGATTSTTQRPGGDELRSHRITATRMTEDDSSSGEGKVADARAGEGAGAALGGDNDDDDDAAPAPPKSSVAANESKRYGFSVMLVPTLLFKFTIVLCIKFATDVVVFPSLFLYRLARLGKRKIVRGFNNLFRRGGGDFNVKVNGDSSSADDSAK
jgi:hypothetical protein